jgi:hypothetical protein
MANKFRKKRISTGGKFLEPLLANLASANQLYKRFIFAAATVAAKQTLQLLRRRAISIAAWR